MDFSDWPKYCISKYYPVWGEVLKKYPQAVEVAEVGLHEKGVGHYGNIILDHFLCYEKETFEALCAKRELVSYIDAMMHEMRELAEIKIDSELARYVLPTDGNPEPKYRILDKICPQIEWEVIHEILFARHPGTPQPEYEGWEAPDEDDEIPF